eukprot:13089252-Alexandrium_andersonii.AAC.1
MAPGVQRVEDGAELGRPRGSLALEPPPGALHVLPARADIGGADDAPAAGAVGLAEGPEVPRAHVERLILGFPEEEHGSLDNAPAPEPHVEAGRAR